MRMSDWSIGSVILVIAIALGQVPFGAASARTIVQAQPFSRRVPPADPQKYKSIRDAKDWANPYLMVLKDQVEIISPTLASGHKAVPVGQLRDALLELPTSAWPYGRV